MKNIENLLNYWYKLEFFSPFWPLISKKTLIINLKSSKYKDFPWLAEAKTDNSYDVYLGKVQSHDLIVKMLETTGEIDDRIEKESSNSCVCAFKLGTDGKYIENTFSVSAFVWALSKIISEKNLRAELNHEIFEKINRSMNEKLLCIERKIEYHDLENILTKVIKMLNIKDVQSIGIINAEKNRTMSEKSKDIRIAPNNENPLEQTIKNDKGNTGTEMISSFFVSDIDMIKREIQADDKIVKYIKAFETSLNNRIEINTDTAHMKKWLSPLRFPIAKWPSKYSPSLMQQIAINITISEDKNTKDFFSVNGPPGTGKTTLLKEIVASNIVERALLLSEYKHPDNAFKKHDVPEPENGNLKCFYQPDPKFNKYGIIVASSNNNAVENISVDLSLSKAVKDANTNLFDININKEFYFSEIADEIIKKEEKCWGLLSAPLGKKSNLEKLRYPLWLNNSAPSLRKLYDEELPNWEQAIKAFKNKYNEVVNYREKIEIAFNNVNHYENLKHEYNLAKNEKINAENEYKYGKSTLEQKRKIKEQLKQKINTSQENLELLQKGLSWFKKIFSFFFKKDPIILKINEETQKIEQYTIELVKNNTFILSTEISLEYKEKLFQNKELQYNEIKKALGYSKHQYDKDKAHFGNNFADEEFWANVGNEDKSQVVCPWTDKKYDTLREELFYHALNLQKAFVLNSQSVRKNINWIVNIWEKELSDRVKKLAFSSIFNTLFFIIPVVSTTFASVSSFLKFAGKNELGTLIIDEAGQATPQSALGALWRTRKAIIVGDPLQVEPVVTIPKELIKKFAKEYNIDLSYIDPEQVNSVQIMADQINPYGGYRKVKEKKMWLGCPLLVHRRCIEPMFSLSNKIAYNNCMVNETRQSEKDVSIILAKSVWLDIKGKTKGNKDHFVLEQGNKVLELVQTSFNSSNEFPSLFIISPFKSVSTSMKNLLKRNLYKHYQKYSKEQIDNWIEESCGTVHTFQGKEANEVIFILGCDKQSGEKAAEWAGKKPNILNVALTRAKYRIAIIGDANLWNEVNNFDEVYKVLAKNTYIH